MLRPPIGRVLELVLRLGEDQAEQAFLLAQFLQRVAVVVEQLVAVPLHQAGPVIAGEYRAGLVVGRPAALVGHLQEQQIGELLDVVAVAHAVVTQDVAVVPEFLDDVCAAHRVVALFVSVIFLVKGYPR